jgi:UDPglucose--hexose-1-phosphate uridylyltransferase
VSDRELETCPFCGGREHLTPPETLVLPAQGEWQVRVVPNLYPAFDRHEVVVHARDHLRSIADLGDAHLDLIAEAWRRRRADAPQRYLHALINEGRAAGASLSHTHSQLVWLRHAPPAEPPREGETVAEDDGLIAWSPRLARVPYELAVAPIELERDGLRSERLGPALRLVADLVRRLRALEGDIPLNAWLHDHESGWRIVVFPRLSVLAALELGAAVYVNTLAPEEAAGRLRAAG